jgi:molybdenum cofactor cytidylyltransferase
MNAQPTVVVVAAGQGKRFAGSEHKLGQPLGGSTVLGTTLRNAVESKLPVVLVTTAALLPLASPWLARRDVVVLAPEDARRGMGHSIAAGVAERAAAPGWLILPGDMPLVQAQTIRDVAQALEHFPVVHAQHKGRRGHPVGFSGELYSELIQLDGDEGARRVAARYPAHGQEVDDPGVLMDVDTQEDLDAARAVLGGAAAIAEPEAHSSDNARAS